MDTTKENLKVGLGILLPFYVIAAAYCFELFMRYFA
jgi:hypothetical protein